MDSYHKRFIWMEKKRIKYGQIVTYVGFVVRSVRSTSPVDCDNCYFSTYYICPFNDEYCSFKCATNGCFKLVKQDGSPFGIREE